MNKFSGLARALALAGSLVIAGCALIEGSGGGTKFAACNSSTCNLTVRVSHCSVSVDNPQLHVAKGGQKQIIWHLRSSDPAVAFAPDGIFFKSATNGQFPDLHKEGGSIFRSTDLNTAGGTYTYGVRVTSSGNACPTLDPIVVNDM